MTQEELEAAAAVFDYKIQPQILDRSAVKKLLDESQAAYDAENAYEPETFGSFADVLISQYPTPNETAKYTFFDLTGDGEEELLISHSNDTIDQWYTVQDGAVQFFWGNDTYLCKGNVLEFYYEDPERSDFHMIHRYTKSDTETAWMDTDPETYGDTITLVSKMDGQWYDPNLLRYLGPHIGSGIRNDFYLHSMSPYLSFNPSLQMVCRFPAITSSTA